MSVREERNPNYLGDPTKIKANHGSGKTPPKDSGASFNTNGVSKIPPLAKNNSFPAKGRINTGKYEIGVVP